jgi:hypothetical protein
MDEVVLDGENGRELVLRRLSDRDDESIWQYQATLRIADVTASRRVYEHGTALRSFFQQLAAAWRGFEGVRSYASLEGDLTIDATHDGHGMVRCRVVVGSLSPPEWSLEAVVEFGAGAHLERIARDIETLVP